MCFCKGNDLSTDFVDERVDHRESVRSFSHPGSRSITATIADVSRSIRRFQDRCPNACRGLPFPLVSVCDRGHQVGLRARREFRETSRGPFGICRRASDDPRVCHQDERGRDSSDERDGRDAIEEGLVNGFGSGFSGHGYDFGDKRFHLRVSEGESHDLIMDEKTALSPHPGTPPI